MAYTVKQISALTELSEHTIRYYTDQGLLPCRRDGANRRVFEADSVQWIKTIQCLKCCGMSIKDMKTYGALCRAGDSTLEARYQILQKQQSAAQERLREAREACDHLAHKVRRYEEILSHAGLEPTADPVQAPQGPGRSGGL